MWQARPASAHSVLAHSPPSKEVLDAVPLTGSSGESDHACLLTPVTPALKRQKQEVQGFKASLGYGEAFPSPPKASKPQQPPKPKSEINQKNSVEEHVVAQKGTCSRCFQRNRSVVALIWGMG